MKNIGTGSTILHLDDDESDRSIFERCFKKAGYGNGIVSLERPQELFDHLDQVEKGKAPMPEALLLDINMPELNGFEVLTLLRLRKSFSSLPVAFILTNSSSPKDTERARELGCREFFTKPTDIQGYHEVFKKLEQLVVRK